MNPRHPGPQPSALPTELHPPSRPGPPRFPGPDRWSILLENQALSAPFPFGKDALPETRFGLSHDPDRMSTGKNHQAEKVFIFPPDNGESGGAPPVFDGVSGHRAGVGLAHAILSHLPCGNGALKRYPFPSGKYASHALPVRRAGASASRCVRSPAFGFLQIPPQDGSPCRSAVRSPVGPEEDLHLQMIAPCRAHIKKGRVTLPGWRALWISHTRSS